MFSSIFSLYVLLFLNLLGSGLVMSSSSWVGVWFGLELSGFSFIPLLLCGGQSKISLVNCWKYILVQSYCSCVMVVGILGFSFSGVNFVVGFIQWLVIFVSVFVKMGLPPFHGWVMHISNSVSWFSFLVLSTLQKIGPMILLSSLSSQMGGRGVELVCLLVMLYSIAGVFVNCIRFFLINSSSLNLAWMMSVVFMSKYVMIFYMIVYFMHVYLLICVLVSGSDMLGSFFYLSRVEFLNNLFVQFIIYSMIGIPPLLGFFMKTMVVAVLLEEGAVYVCSWMLFMSSVFSFVYVFLIVNFLLKEKLEVAESFHSNSMLFPFSLLVLLVWTFWFFG